MHTTDIALIGAGPVGIEIAFALKQAGLDYLHFEAHQIGHTMSWWPAGTRWFSSTDRIAICGVPLQTADQGKATREDYLRYLRCVVQQFDLPIRTYEPVTTILRNAGGFLLHTAGREGPHSVQARRVILATGGTARPRRLGIAGEDLPHVAHQMADPHTYFRQRVLVVGGRNSAVESALRLHQAGAHISLSYRQPELPANSIKYWLYPEIAGLLKSGRITGYFHTTPTRITATQVTLQPAGESRTFDVPADFVLLQVGYVADMSLARMAGVELAEPGDVPRVDPATQQTNIPGLYIAGTAIAGTQDRFGVFLENCHIHAKRIVAALTGRPAPAETAEPKQPAET
jgi:thioredoxin reductase (NADPH)